jgi:hypothetical protein
VTADAIVPGFIETVMMPGSARWSKSLPAATAPFAFLEQ